LLQTWSFRTENLNLKRLGRNQKYAKSKKHGAACVIPGSLPGEMRSTSFYIAAERTFIKEERKSGRFRKWSAGERSNGKGTRLLRAERGPSMGNIENLGKRTPTSWRKETYALRRKVGGKVHAKAGGTGVGADRRLFANMMISGRTGLPSGHHFGEGTGGGGDVFGGAS